MWQPCELPYTCYFLTRKVKPIWILLKQETVSGSGISWAICKSAPRSRQITTPAPHHSVSTGRMPSCCPTNSVKALKAFLMHVSYDAKIQYPEIFNFTLELGKAKQRKIKKRKIISRKVWVLNGQVGYAGQSSISVFLQAGCLSCCPTISVKALKAYY